MSENLKKRCIFQDKNPYNPYNLKTNPYNPYNPYNFRVKKNNPYNPYILATLKISSDQKRFFIALSLYPLSFFANTPFKWVDFYSENIVSR